MMMAACTQTSKNPFLEQWDTPYGVPPFDKIQLSDSGNIQHHRDRQ